MVRAFSFLQIAGLRAYFLLTVGQKPPSVVCHLALSKGQFITWQLASKSAREGSVRWVLEYNVIMYT